MKKQMNKPGWTRIQYSERQVIEEMLNAGISVSIIADKLGRHRGSIYREMERGGTPYSADAAQRNVK